MVTMPFVPSSPLIRCYSNRGGPQHRSKKNNNSVLGVQLSLSMRFPRSGPQLHLRVQIFKSKQTIINNAFLVYETIK